MAAINAAFDRRNQQMEEVITLLRIRVVPLLRISSPIVFLVGAAASVQDSLREAVRRELTDPHLRGSKIDVIYPEEVFEELMGVSKARAYDLLQLENLLAENCHAVVILLEGAGAIAEFGAFVNHEMLRQKLIIVIDHEKSRHSSFIVQGPVRFLRSIDKWRVINHDFRDRQVRSLSVKIRQGVSNLYESQNVPNGVSNPLVSMKLALACIYALEPIERWELRELLRRFARSHDPDADVVLSAATGMLIREHSVQSSSGILTLTNQGVRNTFQHFLALNHDANVREAFDRIRILKLNSTLRTRRLPLMRRPG